MNIEDLENKLVPTDELLADDSPIEPTTLDLGLIKEKIPTHSSKKLCEMIVCDRYFGFNQEISVMCMEELAERRVKGDVFDFENYIEEAYKELPPLDFSGGFDIRAVLTQAIRKP